MNTQCPKCKNPVFVTADDIGDRVICPGCHRPFDVKEERILKPKVETISRPKAGQDPSRDWNTAATKEAAEPAPSRGRWSPVMLLLSLDGRISRLQYFAGALMLSAIDVLLLPVVFALPESAGEVSLFVVLGVHVVGVVALNAKRLHDRNRSAAWLLAALIPVAGGFIALWLVVEMWFLQGTDGPNDFGEDPTVAFQQHQTPVLAGAADSEEGLREATR